MKNSYLKLDKILSFNKWQTLQDSLSEVTKLAIITVDFKGIPITNHSNCHPFCELVRANPDLVKNCQKCDSRGGLEAVRINAPYIYLCHYNIVDIAIPISIDDKYVGAVMAGQIKLASSDQHNHLEQIYTASSKTHLLNDDLTELYDTIPTLTYDDIFSYSRMLFHLCNYIVEEAMNKNIILEMYETILQLNGSRQSPKFQNEYSLENVQLIKNEISTVVTNAYVDASSSEPFYCSKILKPAFHYIYNHKKEIVSLKEAAELCHISPSYFSRLFHKETGDSFCTYIGKLKVEWAKQLLEKTDISVTNISDELGFNEPGYFIKTFKRYENITPAIYRKYYNQ